MRKRQAKKIIRREAARYLAVAFGAEEGGFVDPRESGVLTLHNLVQVQQVDVVTLRGHRRADDTFPRMVEGRLHGVPQRLLYPKVRFKQIWRGRRRDEFDDPSPMKVRWRRRFLRPCAGELAVMHMPDGTRVAVRRHVARGDQPVDGQLDWTEIGRRETWRDVRWRTRCNRERQRGRRC